CGKAKKKVLSRAEDLYTGPPFRAARNYARRRFDSRYILSALHTVCTFRNFLNHLPGSIPKSLGNVATGERTSKGGQAHRSHIRAHQRAATEPVQADDRSQPVIGDPSPIEIQS
ncbi:MAG: DUF6884 domain-containing protein, partial [Archangium sp.]